MRVGLIYDFANPPRWPRDQAALFQRQLDQIVWAEELGIDSVWLAEHHFWEDGHVPSPIPILAAMAARTSRVSVGASVLLAPLYHPVRLAEDAALIDAISGGRLELGLGLGWAAEEYEAFGVDPSTRVSQTRELIEILRMAWTEDQFVYSGKHFQIGPLSVTPKPVQRPHPVIWGGGNTPEAGRRLGRWGLPLQCIAQPVVEAYLEGRRENGHPVEEARIGDFLWMYVCDDPERTWQEIREQVRHQIGRYRRRRWLPGGEIVEAQPFTEPGERPDGLGYSVVTPEQAIDTLKQRIAAAGMAVDHLHCFGAIPGVADALNDRHVELMATVVAPAVR